MKAKSPPFREGIEWKRDGAWKYVLLKDVFIEVETGLTRHYDCRDESGNLWVSLLPHGILMKKSYAWDGNTASPDRIFKSSTLLGSLPHDGLFQFSGAIGFPRNTITLAWANDLYYALTPKWIAWAYRTGLFLGSWALWGKPKPGDYVESFPLHQPEPT